VASGARFREDLRSFRVGARDTLAGQSYPIPAFWVLYTGGLKHPYSPLHNALALPSYSKALTAAHRSNGSRRLVPAKISFGAKTAIFSVFVREQRLNRHLLDLTQRIVGVLVTPSHFTSQLDQPFGIGQ
jgi:hypothetical protein